MQQKKNNFRIFLERTDELAHKLRIPLRELGAVIGMSTASLFGYRAGKIPLSSKAWGKLEAAEKAAGIGQEEHAEKPVTRDELPQMPSNLVTRDEIAEIGAKLDRLTDLMEMLIEQRATSSSGLGQAVKTTRKNSA